MADESFDEVVDGDKVELLDFVKQGELVVTIQLGDEFDKMVLVMLAEGLGSSLDPASDGLGHEYAFPISSTFDY